MMRSTGRVTNAMLQAWGVDRVSAGAALKDLVGRGIAVNTGGRRYASYHLVADCRRRTHDRPIDSPDGVEAELDAVVQVIGPEAPRPAR